MPCPSIRSLPTFTATIRDLAIRRPFIPKRFKPDTLLFRRILCQRCRASNEHTVARRVSVIVEFAFKVLRCTCAIFHDLAGLFERFTDVAVTVSYAAVIERLPMWDTG